MAQFKSGDLQTIDLVLGNVVSIFRRDIGLSQTEVGAEVGLSPEQIEDRENGIVSITAGELYAIGEILGIKCETFYFALREPDLILARINEKASL